MPEFTTEIDIEPSEFVDSCSRREINALIETLIEDGYINTSALSKNCEQHGVRRPNINDEIFWESLDHLKKCRDLLSVTEEEFINNLAKRFQHLR
jgi:hypothetical protein